MQVPCTDNAKDAAALACILKRYTPNTMPLHAAIRQNFGIAHGDDVVIRVVHMLIAMCPMVRIGVVVAMHHVVVDAPWQ